MRQRAVHHPTTAEVRFNMLARGWLAYPRDTGGTRNYRRRAVVEMPSPHRHRRGATALFRNPVRGAHPSHLACRRYATTYGGTADSTC